MATLHPGITVLKTSSLFARSLVGRPPVPVSVKWPPGETAGPLGCSVPLFFGDRQFHLYLNELSARLALTGNFGYFTG